MPKRPKGVPTGVVATSQVSRFAADTWDTLSSDIDLHQVNISVGDRELLVDTDLRLFSGVRYGLVGRNGCGKSTLLQCIGDNTLTGLSDNLRCLRVEQLSLENEGNLLDAVLRADKKRVRLLEQVELLEKGDAESVRKVQWHNQRALYEGAVKTANERSGARGAKARRVLNAEEAALEKLEQLHLEAPSPEEQAESILKAQELLAEVHAELALYDSEETFQNNARAILTGLGFTDEMQMGLVEHLSGGWRIRAALAAALLLKPDVLLLDEPTNHLDLPTILWLQEYLQTVEGTVLVVSHDRAFLNAVCQEIVLLKNQALEYHKGNYDEYRTNFEEKQVHNQTLADAVEKKKVAAVKSIEKGIATAKKSGDDKKMAAMASKKKKLDRLGMEASAKGTRFKLNRDRQGFYNTIRDDVGVEKDEVAQTWKIQQPYTLRYSGDLVMVDGVAFRYSPTLKYIFGGVTLSVSPRARIALVGANGKGKSTLMNLLAGNLKPSAGTIQWPGNSKIGVFSQHVAEDFSSYAVESTPVSVLAAKFPDRKESEVRSHLAMFGLKGSIAMQPLGSLSGGELARVSFAMSFFGSTPHILILDEPTNHLDMLLIESLINMLKSYEGAVIVSSHDQHFVSEVADQLYTIEKYRLKKLEGMDDYISLISQTKK